MSEMAWSFYAIYWPDEGVFKVGKYRSTSRVRRLTATGGHLIVMLRRTPHYCEKAALSALREAFPPAFDGHEPARDLLPLGRGHTECFKVPHAQVGTAYKTIVRGIASYAVHASAEAETDLGAGPVISGAPDRRPVSVGSCERLSIELQLLLCEGEGHLPACDCFEDPVVHTVIAVSTVDSHCAPRSLKHPAMHHDVSEQVRLGRIGD